MQNAPYSPFGIVGFSGSVMHGCFLWQSTHPIPPARWDLRLLGWQLVERDHPTAPLLVDGRCGALAADWSWQARRARAAAVGVDDAEARAALLSGGFGEALPSQVAISELAVRLTRLVETARALPRLRSAGPVELDLFHRDARAGGRWLGLHPREFGLLWRLAEAPGERCSRERLLADVWRLAHVPETNSLEVHVSRLRAKLATAKIRDLVETDPAGGYRLAHDSRARSVNWTAAA